MDIALISPVSPFSPPDGHRMAILSDLHAILDNKLRPGLITFAHGGEKEVMPPLCDTRVIPALGGGFSWRFLRGLFKRQPPSVERLYSHAAYRSIRSALREWKPPVIVIDDVSVAGYLPLIRDILPNARIALRSHNVMHDVRLDQLRRTHGLQRAPIEYDCHRYLQMERNAVEQCDAHWAITPADAARMLELYGRPASSLTVSIPVEKYDSLKPDDGKSNGFVHVGTLDFRRRSELKDFLTANWPKVLQTDPAATLTLAGSFWGRAIEAPNVSYHGRVVSDDDVYKLGRFALNFQSSTGGVKLKTLTSLAARRTLVSTARGVEGLPLVAGRQYWDIEAFLSAPDLREILKHARATQPIADAGRQYVAENHSRTCVERQFRTLLDALH
jgi:hypothetical protein